MVAYIKDNPDTTHKTVDSEKETFLNRLNPYGFTPLKKSTQKSKKQVRQLSKPHLLRGLSRKQRPRAGKV